MDGRGAVIGDVFAAEGAAVETSGGLIFTVKGLVHPPGHVVAYLRYVPDEGGERVRDGRRYRRVYSFADQEEALRRLGLDYAREDPALGVRVEAVPLQDVVRAYDPRERLEELRRGGPHDAPGEAALELAELLRTRAGVPARALGITGSLLLGLQAPGSDVDIVVYGEAACRRVHAALGPLLDDERSGLARPAGEHLTAIHAAHRADTPLSAVEFARHQARKVNEGQYRGRPYFVRFVKLPHESPERYGDPRRIPVGPVVAEALVADAGDALFTPCQYRVAGGVALTGELPGGLDEIVSFRGRFADQATAGQHVRARGMLERVVWRGRPERACLVVGGPGDYLLTIQEPAREGPA